MTKASIAEQRTMYRSSDPDTSKSAAYAFSEARLSEIQQAVLDFFVGRKRATDAELISDLGQRYPADSTLRKRRCDLVRKGYLRDSGQRQINANSRKMVVWELAVA